MEEALLKEIYTEVVKVREKIELLEEVILPKESLSQGELLEILKRKKESLKGEHVDWEDLKKELAL